MALAGGLGEIDP
jgi:hypothetical protein